MTFVDWLAVAFVLLLAVGGARKGLFVGGLSLVGVVGGCTWAGAWHPFSSLARTRRTRRWWRLRAPFCWRSLSRLSER